jgi:hypothetical protein
MPERTDFDPLRTSFALRFTVVVCDEDCSGFIEPTLVTYLERKYK